MGWEQALRLWKLSHLTLTTPPGVPLSWGRVKARGSQGWGSRTALDPLWQEPPGLKKLRAAPRELAISMAFNPSRHVQPYFSAAFGFRAASSPFHRPVKHCLGSSVRGPSPCDAAN